MVAVCAVVTDETIALKPVVDAREETVTALGTVTAALLLVRLTFTLLLVGAVKYTEQGSDPAAENCALPQETELSCGEVRQKAATENPTTIMNVMATRLVRHAPNSRCGLVRAPGIIGFSCEAPTSLVCVHVEFKEWIDG